MDLLFLDAVEFLDHLVQLKLVLLHLRAVHVDLRGHALELPRLLLHRLLIHLQLLSHLRTRLPRQHRLGEGGGKAGRLKRNRELVFVHCVDPDIVDPVYLRMAVTPVGA